MTVYLDTSALVGLHLDGPARAVVLAALQLDDDWCSSGLTLMESLALVDRVTDEPALRFGHHLLGRRLARLVDGRERRRIGLHLFRGEALRVGPRLCEPPIPAGSQHRAGTGAGLWRRAGPTDRLPRPVRFVTFDPAQIPVAMSMGFDVTST